MLKLFLCNSHVLQSALALCSTLRVYLDEYPLTPDDVNAICAKLLRPEVRARHKFAADLIADLSRLVANRLRKREAQREVAVRAAETKAFAVKKVIAADLFKPE